MTVLCSATQNPVRQRATIMVKDLKPLRKVLGLNSYLGAIATLRETEHTGVKEPQDEIRKLF